MRATIAAFATLVGAVGVAAPVPAHALAQVTCSMDVSADFSPSLTTTHQDDVDVDFSGSGACISLDFPLSQRPVFVSMSAAMSADGTCINFDASGVMTTTWILASGDSATSTIAIEPGDSPGSLTGVLSGVVIDGKYEGATFLLTGLSDAIADVLLECLTDGVSHVEGSDVLAVTDL